MTALPAWVSHALDNPAPTGIRGTVNATRCPYCYRVVLRARDHFDFTCDPHPLTVVGEVLALTDSRTTFALLPTRYGSRHKRLSLRLPVDITRHPPGTPHRPHGQIDVLAEHRCQPFTYPTTSSAYHPPVIAAAINEGQSLEPPF